MSQSFSALSTDSLVVSLLTAGQRVMQVGGAGRGRGEGGDHPIDRKTSFNLMCHPAIIITFLIDEKRFIVVTKS